MEIAGSMLYTQDFPIGCITVPDGIRMKTMSREELAVAMKPDANFVRDLILFNQPVARETDSM